MHSVTPFMKSFTKKMVMQVDPLTSAERSHFFLLHRLGPAQINPSHKCNHEQFLQTVVETECDSSDWKNQCPLFKAGV